MTESKCGKCVYLIKEDGEPYYCAIKDLYTFRKEEDNACDEYEFVDEERDL